MHKKVLFVCILLFIPTSVFSDQFSMLLRNENRLQIEPDKKSSKDWRLPFGSIVKLLEISKEKNLAKVHYAKRTFWTTYDKINIEPKDPLSKVEIKSVKFDNRDIKKNIRNLEACSWIVNTCTWMSDEIAFGSQETRNAQKLKKQFIIKYSIVSEIMIRQVTESIFVSQIVVKKSGCYETEKIGNDYRLLSNRLFSDSNKEFNLSYTITTEELLNSKLKGDIQNADLILILNVQYIDGKEETYSRKIDIIWPQCM